MANACRCGDKLSPREEQYLDLLAKGNRPEAIAQKFGCNMKTLHSTMKNIKIKLGTATTWETMYVWGTKRGCVRATYIYF